ncbi:trehalose/maltose ABC transporter substrate-binding protein [Paenibacillus antibioticophila]|uniref:Trehalose/maltose ABC transporter substrate-binding protein n=2 Tax=Paenibacillus TaxID=44249 RepID=A0A919Y1E2_9BACL|nr:MULTISPECIES: ABC transporter substrate-binding protein [Paenibacillus]GIO36519.1 trehalose/maltose ABC transporter substrate-binding protein [Paenibacillus antibioticophila]GIO43101.1 trehalose/maltose ABC transporter substrate-binding protein [Paenibacillus apis]
MKLFKAKKIWMPLIAASLVLSLTACGGNSAKPGAEAPDTDEPVTITFSFDQGIGQPAQTLIDEYNASQEKYIVESKILPQDANVVHDDFVNKLASGDTSVDVMALDVVYVAEFASAGWLTDLTQYFDQATQDLYLPGTIETATYNEKLVAFPWFTNASALFYRKDVLEQLGVEPPTTYQGWMDLQSQVQGVNDVQYTSVFQAALSEALVCNWVEYVANNGGEILDADGNPVVNSENNIEATQIMLDLVKNYAPEGVTTYNEPESEQVFLDGKALFIRDWSGFWSQANKEGSKVKDKVGVTSLPVGPKGTESHSTLGGLNLVINNAIDDAHKEAAVDFIKYLSSESVQKKMNLIAAQPPVLKSVYQDAEVLEANPFYADFYDIIMNGKARPMSPQYARVSDSIQRNIHAALAENIDIKTALDTIQSDIEALNK